MSTKIEIHKDIKEKLAKMAKMLAEKDETLEVKEVLKDILNSYKEEYAKNREFTWEDEEEHQSYTFGVVYRLYMTAGPTSMLDIIPIGFATPNVSSKGTFGNLYAAFIEEGAYQLKNVVLKNGNCDILDNITLYQKYQVPGSLSKQDGSIWLSDNVNVKSLKPVDPGIKPEQLINKLQIPKVPLSDVWEFVSKLAEGKDGKWYADKNDWRMIKGQIIRKYQGKNKNGIEFYTYTIFDPSSVDMDQVTEDGRIIGEFGIFLDKRLWVYPVDSICYFLGPVSKREATDEKAEQISMNAYSVIPIRIVKEN